MQELNKILQRPNKYIKNIVRYHEAQYFPNVLNYFLPDNNLKLSNIALEIIMAIDQMNDHCL